MGLYNRTISKCRRGMKFKLYFQDGKWNLWHPVKGCLYHVTDFWFTWDYLFNN